MVSLTALWLPILLSAVVVFLASAVLHMVLKYHYKDYQKLPDEEGLRAAMREAGVKPGADVTHLPLPKDLFATLAEQLMEVRAMLPNPALRMLERRSRSLERGLQVLLDSVASKRPTRIWAVLPEMLRVQ